MNLYEEGYLDNNRRLILNGEIDSSVLENIWLKLVLLEEQSEEPIELVINSEGGSCLDVGYLCDHIMNMKNRVITRGTGRCESAGFLLLISGDYRIVYSKTRLTIHSMCISGQTDMSINEVQDYINLLKRDENKWFELINNRCTLSERILIDGLAKFEWDLDPLEAKEFGFVDKVIVPKYRKF